MKRTDEASAETALHVLLRLSEESTDGRLRDSIALVRSALRDELEAGNLEAAPLPDPRADPVTDWPRLDESPAASAQMIQWHAPATFSTVRDTRPLLDRAEVREDIRKGINAALFNGGHPAASTGWSPSAEVDRITNAVMELARPMPTRGQIIEALTRAEGRSSEGKSAEWRQLAEETFGFRADAVLALINAACTCPTDADVTPDMRTETGQHLSGCHINGGAK